MTCSRYGSDAKTLAAACLLVPLAACTSAPAPAPASASVRPSPIAVPETPAGVQRYHATELRPGDCIDPIPQNFEVTVVPCDVPHVAEFAATYVLPDGPFPGADMRRLVENGCLPRMRIKDDKRDAVALLGFGPTAADWPRYRTVYCLAMSVDWERTTGRVVK
ncbi:hypothetical protein ACTMTF_47085 [Nonomuraea sp. ZG12]|uniref:hypothetical protein n=1 Tax=Nonomuraea sp. ZG12 TaxID=3452207 RepID=UPI003F8C01DE